MTLTSIGFNYAESRWSEWALDQQKTAEEIDLCAPLDRSYSEMSALVINRVTFTTSKRIEEMRSTHSVGAIGTQWVILKAKFARILFNHGVEEERDVKPIIGKIKSIIEHNSFHQPEGCIMLDVDWFTSTVSPLGVESTSAYDTMHLAIIDMSPSTELRTHSIVPIERICPLQIIVMPHPTSALVQVVIPTNNDVQFLVAAGYRGPMFVT
jgi:hypothetical protein